MNKDVTSIWLDFHKELKGFIYQKTKNIADTDDILQEVFLKVIRNIEKLNQSDNLQQYLYGIVRNTMNDYFTNRKKNAVGLVNDQIMVSVDDQSLNQAIAACCVIPFIHQLPSDYKEALLMTEFQHISQKEIAAKLNISYSGAKSRVQRGREKLKNLILNCCAYENDVYGNLISNDKTGCDCAL